MRGLGGLDALAPYADLFCFPPGGGTEARGPLFFVSYLYYLSKLYELLANCIPADLVMCYLTKALLKKIPLPLKHQTLHWAAQFEHRMQAGSKPIFHIEAYLARFMSIAKQASTGGRR